MKGDKLGQEAAPVTSTIVSATCATISTGRTRATDFDINTDGFVASRPLASMRDAHLAGIKPASTSARIVRAKPKSITR
jgi:hypothetical protein